MQTLGEVAGKFKVEWDERRGSGVLTVQGFWTLADAAKFYPLLGSLVAMSRARHGHALILFDASNAVVQNGSLMQAASEKRDSDLRETDRVALVAGSSLLKMQIKRSNAALAATEYFISRSAADTWLHAHVEADSSIKHPAAA